MRLVPVGGGARIDLQRHMSCTAGCGASTITVLTTGSVSLDLLVRHLEDQFVMHLQQHVADSFARRQRRRPCAPWRGG